MGEKEHCSRYDTVVGVSHMWSDAAPPEVHIPQEEADGRPEGEIGVATLEATVVENKEHARMLSFTEEKVAQDDDDWLPEHTLDEQVLRSIRWMQELSVQQIIARREKAIRSIEKRAKKLIRKGKVERWLSQAETQAAVVSAGVNGPLLYELGMCSSFVHTERDVEAFRSGAPILGGIPAAASAVSHEHPPAGDPALLASQCYTLNQELLASLRADPHADFLMTQTRADAELGRMSEPVPVDQLDLHQILLSRRFSCEQGVKENGEPKCRAVDDLSANGCNHCAQPEGKTKVDSIDLLVRMAVCLSGGGGRQLEFWKADIDAAYRRVPLREGDKWAAWVAFLHEGRPVASCHHALMFGALGSVHGWDRIGAMIRHIARTHLGLALGRYVDDFFAVEALGTAEHAMQCFARLVRALLGGTALRAEKLDWGLELEVLGLRVSYDDHGMRVRVADKKAEEWGAAIGDVLESGRLPPGTASKLAGRLGFAAQHTFRRAGRAALRPLFRQQYNPLRGGRLSGELRQCLEWWLHALQNFQAQAVPWTPAPQKVTMFTDARSTPPRVAAVLVVDGTFLYTDWEPDPSTLQIFSERKDNQIMGLELLAIAVGICTFEHLVRGKTLRVYCDNVGGERALAAGAAKSPDHNKLIHAVWMIAMRLGLAVWTYRVPTKDNIADLPSRESYELLAQVSEGYTKKKEKKQYIYI